MVEDLQEQSVLGLLVPEEIEHYLPGLNSASLVLCKLALEEQAFSEHQDVCWWVYLLHGRHLLVPFHQCFQVKFCLVARVQVHPNVLIMLVVVPQD